MKRAMRFYVVGGIGLAIIWLAPFAHWYGTYVLVWVMNGGNP